MHKRSSWAVASVAAAALLLAGCGSDDPGTGTDPTTSASSGSGSAPAAGGSVGVILPDSATSPRWEANDRPLLQAAFDDAGIEADIQNADGDTSKFATLCDGMINAGVSVLLIVNLDSDSGAACLSKAQDAGVETIDYDRLTLGGGASFYVSFDNVKVGSLMGEGLEKCLTDAGKETGANIVFINGAPTDNNATLFKQGYQEYLQPKFDAGDYTLVGDVTGEWDADIAGTAFEQIYTDNGGAVDGVVSANDTMAGGIIARLAAAGVNGQIPVTGQDASVAGLQAILAGDQCMTVYKAIKAEADAASELAIALINGDDTSGLATGTVEDTQLGSDVPSVLADPVAIYRDTVKTVIDDGFWTAAEICTGDYADDCAELGIE